MPMGESQIRGLQLPNTLEVPSSHIALVVGHLLRDLYTNLGDDQIPERHKELLDQIEEEERLAMRSSRR